MDIFPPSRASKSLFKCIVFSFTHQFRLNIDIDNKRHWPNISANNPDPGSGSKNFILNWDNFLMDDPVKDFFLGGDHMKGNFWNSQQPIIHD